MEVNDSHYILNCIQSLCCCLILIRELSHLLVSTRTSLASHTIPFPKAVAPMSAPSAAFSFHVSCFSRSPWNGTACCKPTFSRPAFLSKVCLTVSTTATVGPPAKATPAATPANPRQSFLGFFFARSQRTKNERRGKQGHGATDTAATAAGLKVNSPPYFSRL